MFIYKELVVYVLYESATLLQTHTAIKSKASINNKVVYANQLNGTYSSCMGYRSHPQTGP